MRFVTTGLKLFVSRSLRPQLSGVLPLLPYLCGVILSLMAALSLSTNSSFIASTNAAKEFEQLLAADEAAQTDIQSWTRVATNSKPLEGLAKTNFELGVSERLRSVKAAYKESIARYPEYA